MISTYSQAKIYLEFFVNREKQANFSYRKSLTLERVFLLFKHLNIPYQKLRVIHIAGTKGKGSTACICSFLLAANDYRVGLYTSPHFHDFRERIQIVDSRSPIVHRKLISKVNVVKIVEEFRKKLNNFELPRSLGEVSFFEIYTAVAFKYFLEKKVDFTVLETGLGGRLDATNIADPLVSIITRIDYEHTDQLGKKLRNIAREKAGIIKEKVAVISFKQRPSVLKVIKDKCRDKNSELFVFGKDFNALNIRLKNKSTAFDFHFNRQKFKNLNLKLKGECQVQNSSLSLAALSLLEQKGLLRNKLRPREALSECNLEGRFEIVSRKPLVIVDVAHDSSSFEVLRDNLKVYFPKRKVILIFGCAKDKDAKNMLKQISCFNLILTSFSNIRSYNPVKLQRNLRLKRALVTDNIEQAYLQARKAYKSNSLILVAGSFFLVSEFKKLYERI